SADDGRSWFRGGDPAMQPWTECSRKAINGPYATLAFDPGGVLYVAFYANDPRYAFEESQPLHIFLARSDDGGRTFRTSFVWRSPEPVTANEGLHNNDRPMLAVDQRNPDNVYVAWMQRGKQGEKPKSVIAASQDGGTSFGAPIDLSDEMGGYQARPAVAPDGTVHAIFPAAGFDPDADDPFATVRPIYHRASSDQGRTWTPQVEVDQGNAGFYANRKHVLAVDQNSGALYAVWYGNPEPLMNPLEDDVDVFLRSSRDGGRTWSDRVTVNDDADQHPVNHYDPGIAVAPNGRVDIAWYDFRNSPYPERFPEDFSAPFNHDGYQDVYYSWSDDGGRTFAPNVRVSDRIINREIGVWSNNVHSHMSVGIASTDDAVYFAWQDSRNGNEANQAEDIYMAAVRHAGPATAAPGGVPARMALAAGGAGVALGMGIAMLIAWAVARRRVTATAAEAAAPSEVPAGR
ncbi:MAG TPA: sialidase family protein, partial [Egibacteraceae bacterium]|nr:sialidase family protein [Egibacteraceae bacterium]